MAKNIIAYNFSLNGKKASEVIASVNTTLNSVSRSQFKVATQCSYLTGITIPAFHDYGEATIDKKERLSQQALLDKVEKDHATVSRWIKAVKLIIDNNEFVSFAEGVFQFSYDKIIWYYENKEDKLADYTIADIMAMTTKEIKALLKEEKDTDTTKVTFAYAGATYEVSKNKLEAFIAANCKNI